MVSCFLAAAHFSPPIFYFLVKRLRILHLEDDADDAEIACATLRDAGLDADCKRVDNWPEFQRELHDGGFDLVLADYSLPTFDGEKALALAQQVCPNVPFLFLSGAMGEERAIETLKNGATDYILKHRLERLPNAVRRALAESQTRIARARAQEALLFLAGAGGILGTSLDFETTLQNLAQLAVPFLADLCIVDVLSEEDEQIIAVGHLVPSRAESVRQMRERYPLDAKKDGVSEILRSGRSRLMPRFNEGRLRRYARDEEHLRLMLAMKLHSVIVVPLEARGRTLGMITFATTSDGSARRYDEHDLALAENLAGRAALAVDNARLYRETQGALRARDEFLATLSHELRTPLNAMLGWTQLLRSGALDETMTGQALEIIERNTKAQGQLIEDLLEVSRIITGKLRLEVRPVELNTVISDALESVRLSADAKGIALEYAKQSDSTISGDAHRLQQVVWNLLSNAIKFTPKGGEVSVVLGRADSHARVVVRDTGQGIAPDFLPHVFERFRQADASSTRSYGGLGLGLGIVRHLVELHGGTVRAESEGENEGATFTVLLPLLALQSTADEVASLAEQRMHIAPSEQNLREQKLRNVRILVVDDHADARRLIAAVLQGCGAQVEVASSAREALDRLQNADFDVLVSDIGMPEEDGYSLMRRVRQLDGARGQIPALALTAYARESDREKALQCGFQGHGVKPLEPAKLVELVARLAGRDEFQTT